MAKGKPASAAKLKQTVAEDEFLPLDAAAGGSGAVERSAAAAPSVSGQDEPSRVIYIGHLPYGFIEKGLLGFFSQFGKLTRVRLSRNKKTARPKHYAFLEFQYPEVAEIAAQAMNGYFMFKQRITCKVVPKSRIHPELFKGANRKFKSIPWAKIERRRHDKERTPEEHARRVARLIKRDQQRAKRIAAAGIEYSYEPVKPAAPAAPKRITFDD